MLQMTIQNTCLDMLQNNMTVLKSIMWLSEDSPDFNRVGTYGNIVKYKSEKNKLLYLMADKVISTHPYESGINPFFSYDQKKDEREKLQWID